MSQHHFYLSHLEQPCHILMGWDKPLQGYFMVIEKPQDADRPFWSNLDYTPAHPKSLDRFIEILNFFGLHVPCQMLEEVRCDGEGNIGNKVVLHQLHNGIYYRKDKVSL
jgi:hypothetical protein